MRSSKSFFNKAILVKDITRFMPLWLTFAVLSVLNLTDATTLFFGGAGDSVGYAFANGVSTNFTFALVAGLCLFGDISNRRMCNAVHTLPVRRETWYATHLLAGFLFWIGPMLLKTLIYVLTLGQIWYVGLLWLGAMIIQYLFFLTLAALCAVCTGTRMGMVAMYLLINLGAWLLYALASIFYQPVLVGITIPEDWVVFLCPVAQLGSADYVKIQDVRQNMETIYLFQGLEKIWWYMLGIGVLSVGLVALGIFAYKKRNLEHAGEFVVFRPLKPVIWTLLALTIGLVFESVGLLSGTVTVFLIIGLSVGGMLAEMMVMKTGKTALKGLGKGVVLAAVIGLSIFVVSLDPLGVVRWVPNPEDVEYVRISEYYYDGGSYTIRDDAEIRQVVDAHKILTEVGLTEYELDWAEYEYGEITIRYRMKDGSMVERRYYYEDNTQVSQALHPLFTKADYVLGYEDWGTFLEENQHITVHYTAGHQTLTPQQSEELLTAVRKDCKQGTWDQSGLWKNDGYCSIGLEDGGWVAVSAGCTNTVQWLAENLPEVFL